MKNNKKPLFLNALIMLPMFTTFSAGSPMVLSAVAKVNPAILEQMSFETFDEVSPEEEARLEEAAKIDAYFAEFGSPLEGYGMQFVVAAEANGLPWNLLPAISMRESTAYIHACTSSPNNGFGYGGCKIKFDSIDRAIERVAVNLGGNNPKTAHYYEGKDLDGILTTYNSVIPHYKTQVKAIMEDIATIPVENTSVAENTTGLISA